MAFQTESVNVFDVVPELTSKPAKDVGRQQPAGDDVWIASEFTWAACGVHAGQGRLWSSLLQACKSKAEIHFLEFSLPREEFWGLFSVPFQSQCQVTARLS